VGARLSSVLSGARIDGIRRRFPDKTTLGQYRLFELARAEARKASVMMVDEGASGMGYEDATVLATELRRVADAGVAVILVEHNIGFVRRVADRVVVLNLGAVLAEGEPEAVLASDDVREAYLGDRSS
jgi:ABC-type branched-subunit amino acid transport system ATPase component